MRGVRMDRCGGGGWGGSGEEGREVLVGGEAVYKCRCGCGVGVGGVGEWMLKEWGGGWFLGQGRVGGGGGDDGDVGERGGEGMGREERNGV